MKGQIAGPGLKWVIGAVIGLIVVAFLIWLAIQLPKGIEGPFGFIISMFN